MITEATLRDCHEEVFELLLMLHSLETATAILRHTENRGEPALSMEEVTSYFRRLMSLKRFVAELVNDLATAPTAPDEDE